MIIEHHLDSKGELLPALLPWLRLATPQLGRVHHSRAALGNRLPCINNLSAYGRSLGHIEDMPDRVQGNIYVTPPSDTDLLTRKVRKVTVVLFLNLLKTSMEPNLQHYGQASKH